MQILGANVGCCLFEVLSDVRGFLVGVIGRGGLLWLNVRHAVAFSLLVLKK